MQQSLGKLLLEALSVGMDQERSSLSQFLDTQDTKADYSSSILFIRYYTAADLIPTEPTEPISPDPISTERRDYKQPHTDSSIITLKPISNVAGLQILNHSTGEWNNLEGSDHKNKFIVFAGEELAYHTKGKISASVHRVQDNLKNTESRVSLPFQLRGDLKKFWHENEGSQLKMKMLSFG